VGLTVTRQCRDSQHISAHSFCPEPSIGKNVSCPAIRVHRRSRTAAWTGHCPPRAGPRVSVDDAPIEMWSLIGTLSARRERQKADAAFVGKQVRWRRVSFEPRVRSSGGVRLAARLCTEPIVHADDRAAGVVSESAHRLANWGTSGAIAGNRVDFGSRRMRDGCGTGLVLCGRARSIACDAGQSGHPVARNARQAPEHGLDRGREPWQCHSLLLGSLCHPLLHNVGMLGIVL
jgi:hypothetical protein